MDTEVIQEIDRLLEHIKSQKIMPILLKKLTRTVMLYIKDILVKTNPWQIDWSNPILGEMCITEFVYLNGADRLLTALVEELQDHKFIVRLKSFKKGNLWYLEIETVSDSESHLFSHPTRQALERVFLTSGLGRKILFQDNLYRQSVDIERIGINTAIKQINESIYELSGLALPEGRTRDVIERIQKFFNNSCPDVKTWRNEPEPYDADDEYDNVEEKWDPEYVDRWYPHNC